MQTTIRKPVRNNQINIRATDEERAVIDYAASLVSKNRTDFIIEKAVSEAQNIILDQRIFVLDDTRYLECTKRVVGYYSIATGIRKPCQFR